MKIRTLSWMPSLGIVLAVSLSPPSARAGLQAKIEASTARDDYRFDLNRYSLGLAHSGEWFGGQFQARWYDYSLERDLVGIFPFSGAEGALAGGGHVLLGSWWLAGSVGFQGVATLAGATGEAIVAKAIPIGEGTLTPRLEFARTPLSISALPLSLGILKIEAKAAMAWRSPAWIAEGTAQAEGWAEAYRPNRVANPALALVAANRRWMAHGYLLSQGAGWFAWGVAGKVQWSRENTLVPTRISPTWGYTWYPVSMAPFLWESSLILRASGMLHRSWRAGAQLQLPLLSRETRQWDAITLAAWGTAPLEAHARIAWLVSTETTLELTGTVFAKPWEGWAVWGADGYRQVSIQLGITQDF